MHPLSLLNTKTKQLEQLRETSGTALVYSCGPTVYKPAHIGNMRAYVFADTLNRALRMRGYRVRHVINFTDVGHLTDDADAGEDKVEKQAEEEGGSAREITERMGNLFLTDIGKLGIEKKRYRFPRATEYIREQIDLVRNLEEKGLTYIIDDGVYFDTAKYPAYGALGLSAEDDSHARVTTGEGKKNPHDFALWKLTPPGVRRQQEWDSPWGRGFPGWHAECSAMAMKLLGETIDIHTGGMDHITVHHNNEIAQSEGVTGKPFAHIWMHVAHMTMGSEKLSKSLNNTYTIADLEERGYDPLALRYLFLQASYTTPLSFSFTALDAAQTALTRLRAEYAALPRPLLRFVRRNEHIDRIDEAIADNLNTAKVLAILSDTLKHEKDGHIRWSTLTYADKALGILAGAKKRRQEPVPEDIREMAEKREKARNMKEYGESDRLREEIRKRGYDCLDTADGGTTLVKR